MTSSNASYFETLIAEAGQGWTRFWFSPTSPLPLGALRIAVGLIALYLVASYTPDLDRYFGERGILPVSMLTNLEQATRIDLLTVPPQVRESMPREYRFSYLDWCRTSLALKAAHVAGLCVLTLFTLGFFTRATAVASLVVFLSYLHRGPMLTSGAEPVVAWLLFYLCLGPCGSIGSLDARLRARQKLVGERAGFTDAISSAWATVALRLIQVHLTVLFAMMAVSKIGSETWWNGMGIWWLIARTESRMIDLTLLHEVPLLVNALTYAVLFWQLLMPIFVWNRLARPLMLGLNAVMWLLLAPIIGNLPLAAVMIAASIAFVSPQFLRKFLPARTAEESAVVARAV